ncbi:hypothetical protein BDZ97DRAFT_1774899 [Flammula alnicola]|nr:hypothetical protein BDZ97DRAFT_1774899 [Flammula alnicola]
MEDNVTVMDTKDVSWMDKDTEEDAPRVKTISSRQRPRVRQQDLDPLEMDGTMGPPFGKPTEQLNASSKQWYAQENKSRNAGTSRSVGGSAITGHTKAKPKTGTGSVRKGPLGKKSASASASSSTVGNKPVKAERSMLSAIADKSRHFA